MKKSLMVDERGARSTNQEVRDGRLFSPTVNTHLLVVERTNSSKRGRQSEKVVVLPTPATSLVFSAIPTHIVNLGDPTAGLPGVTGLLDPAIGKLSALAEFTVFPSLIIGAFPSMPELPLQRDSDDSPAAVYSPKRRPQLQSAHWRNPLLRRCSAEALQCHSLSQTPDKKLWPLKLEWWR